MNRLKAEIKAALVRGGSGVARREAQQQVSRHAQQGMAMATETLAANEADFGHHYEDWNGAAPEPKTPREDPHHIAKARLGRMAERFLLALKVIFWIVFGPAYFAVLAWIAVIVAVCISITLSLGVKPLLAGLILKPGLTPHEKERRLHVHVVAGIVAFTIAFGSLFLLRGLAGPLALLGAMLVLPVLSACDLVLLYLMGIAHAFAHLYSWAAPFVQRHYAASSYRADFEHHYRAAQNRLAESSDNALASPVLEGTIPMAKVSSVAGELKKLPESPGRTTDAAMITLVILLFGVTQINTANAQVSPTGATVSKSRNATLTTPGFGDALAELRWDSTTSMYATIADTIAPLLARTFPIWADQLSLPRLRISTFERDGWLPRTIAETSRDLAPSECAARQTEGTIFRGISEALEKQTRDACDHERARETQRTHAIVAKALSIAAHSPPVVGARSCTAFLDTLMAAASAPLGSLIVIASDTEETCTNGAALVPHYAAGADVIIVVLPSKADMSRGVSAASRFAAKKAYLQKTAPWLRAILAPAEVEFYRIPTQPSIPPLTKVSFWQR